LHGGWYLLALTEELTGEVSPVDLGDRALMAVREGERIRVFDACCPHRGAHLGYGGTLAAGRAAGPVTANTVTANTVTAGTVICPFHGKRIGLGAGTGRLCVAEHTSILAGNALFVRLGTDPAGDRGFEQLIKEISAEKEVSAALVQPLSIDPQYVIENAFDVSHFTAVHKVSRVTGFRLRGDGPGWIAVEGDFLTKPPPWEAQGNAAFHSRFYARAVSPSLVLTELGPPETSHTVITAANPVGARADRVGRGGCVARVAIGVRPGDRPALPALVDGARRAFAQDIVVWNHLNTAAPERFDSADVASLAFRQFCGGFGSLEELRAQP
jgi:nitrite reductase/ring-hydroxylating ferredoxin subunit